MMTTTKMIQIFMITYRQMNWGTNQINIRHEDGSLKVELKNKKKEDDDENDDDDVILVTDLDEKIKRTMLYL